MEHVALSYLDPFIRSVSTLVTLAVLTVLSIVAAVVVPRRRAAVLAAGLASAAVGAFTLPPSAGWSAFAVQSDPLRAIITTLQPRPSDLSAWTQADGPANVALFLPFGLTLALLLRRPIVAALLGSLASAAIEAYQAGTGTRVGSFADIVANSVGSAAGAAVGAGALLVAAVLGRLDATRQASACIAADRSPRRS